MVIGVRPAMGEPRSVVITGAWRGLGLAAAAHL
jgi:NAD(P)-dependent dehydrogenase (short-subunit alcohol dehydrogenase family)